MNGLNIEHKGIIILTNERRHFGYIRTNTKGVVEITLDDGIVEHYKLYEIVALTGVDDKF